MTVLLLKMAAETLPIQDEIQEKKVTEKNAQAIDKEIDNLLANATLQDRPEALRQITKGTSITDESAKIGRELEQTTESITQELYRNSEETSEKYETTVLQAILELVDAVLPVEGKEEAGTVAISTQQLDKEFDDAVGRLIKVPFADQTSPERLITFLKCTTFAIRLVKRYKQSRENESDSRVVWVVRNVGRLLLRAAIRYELYKFIRSNGGWQGMYTAVCSYISRLRDQTDGEGRSMLPKDTYPTAAAVVIVGALLASYLYIRYKN